MPGGLRKSKGGRTLALLASFAGLFAAFVVGGAAGKALAARRHVGKEVRRRDAAVVPATLKSILPRESAEPTGPASFGLTEEGLDPRAIDVQGERAVFTVEGGNDAEPALLIVSCLARSGGPRRVAIRLKPSEHSAPSVTRPVLKWDPIAEPSDNRDRGSSATQGEPAAADHPNDLLPPPPRREFHLMVKDGDVASAGNYRKCSGVLKAFGGSVQVYVDELDEKSIARDLPREIAATFDRTIRPWFERTLGQAPDIDGDGRFTILVSGRLDHLADGKYHVDGFVRAADYDRSIPAPFGNRTDMLYLSASLKPGAHLRTILAHEYTHAMRLGGNRDDAGSAAASEEGWLDEGLAHLTEDRLGFATTNLDYRAAAFLSRPEAHRLVVRDYYAEGLFRSHGNRGAVYLFLKHCEDRLGPKFLEAMLKSQACGTAKLEALAGVPFNELYRDWTIALAGQALGGSKRITDKEPGMRASGAFGREILAGPRIERVEANQAPMELVRVLEPTSSLYLMAVAGSRGIDIEIEAEEPSDLQVTAIRAPAPAARLDLSGELEPGVGDAPPVARLQLETKGAAELTLEALAWELPDEASPSPEDTRIRALGPREIERVLGTTTLKPHADPATSQPIALFGLSRTEGPVVIKAIARDANGLRVFARAEIRRAEKAAGIEAASPGT